MGQRDRLGGIYLFAGLPEDQIRDLSGIASLKPFKKGALIFSEGESATGFYVLSRGKVKIYKLSAEGREFILHILASGEPFGEVPVFTGGNYPAYAEALSDCEALYFPRAEFVRLISGNPSLALNMLALLSRRLKNFTALLEDLSLKEVPGRLAAYLLLSGKKNLEQVELDVSKNQLAGLLGTIPETLSRILTKLARAGFIKQINNRTLVILDEEGLAELAGGVRRLE